MERRSWRIGSTQKTIIIIVAVVAAVILLATLIFVIRWVRRKPSRALPPIRQHSVYRPHIPSQYHAFQNIGEDSFKRDPFRGPLDEEADLKHPFYTPSSSVGGSIPDFNRPPTSATTDSATAASSPAPNGTSSKLSKQLGFEEDDPLVPNKLGSPNSDNGESEGVLPPSRPFAREGNGLSSRPQSGASYMTTSTAISGSLVGVDNGAQRGSLDSPLPPGPTQHELTNTPSSSSLNRPNSVISQSRSSISHSGNQQYNYPIPRSKASIPHVPSNASNLSRQSFVSQSTAPITSRHSIYAPSAATSRSALGIYNPSRRDSVASTIRGAPHKVGVQVVLPAPLAPAAYGANYTTNGGTSHPVSNRRASMRYSVADPWLPHHTPQPNRSSSMDEDDGPDNQVPQVPPVSIHEPTPASKKRESRKLQKRKTGSAKGSSQEPRPDPSLSASVSNHSSPPIPTASEPGEAYRPDSNSHPIPIPSSSSLSPGVSTDHSQHDLTSQPFLRPAMIDYSANSSSEMEMTPEDLVGDGPGIHDLEVKSIVPSNPRVVTPTSPSFDGR